LKNKATSTPNSDRAKKFYVYNNSGATLSAEILSKRPLLAQTPICDASKQWQPDDRSQISNNERVEEAARRGYNTLEWCFRRGTGIYSEVNTKPEAPVD